MNNPPVILLTGASTGIGKATALLLDRLGYRVFAGVRKAADGDALRAEASERLTPIILDVTQKADIDAAYETLAAACGEQGLFALINNAGINYVSPFENTEEDKARQLMEVNVFGLAFITQRMLPLLQKHASQNKLSAKILHVSSIGGAIGIPWESFYHVSKFAVIGLTQAMRLELSHLNIRVAAIMPGGIRTPFFEKSIAQVAPIRAKGGPNSAYYLRNVEAYLATAQQMDGILSPPEKVAKAMLKALRKQNPDMRLLVGTDANIIYGLQKYLPTRWFNGLMQGVFVRK